MESLELREEIVVSFLEKAVRSLVYIYGKDRGQSIYFTNLIQLLRIFNVYATDKKITNSIKGVIHELNLQIYPTYTFEPWEKLQINSEGLDIVNLLYFVSKLDKRLSIAFFFRLGFIEGFETDLDFFRKMGINKNFLVRNSVLAIEAIISNQLEIREKQITKSEVLELMSFLDCLNSIDDNSFLKYLGGNLIDFDSNVYKLAKLISSRVELDTSKLSDKELKMFKTFKHSYLTTGRFRDWSSIYEEVGIVNGVEALDNILEKFVSKSLYRRSIQGYLCEVPADSVLFKLIKIFEKSPNILESTMLSSKERKYLKAYITPDSNGVYLSIELLSKVLEDKANNLTSFFRNLLVKLQSTDSDFDPEGRRVKPNEARVKLLIYSQNFNLELIFEKFPKKKDEFETICRMLLAKEGRNYVFSTNDIIRKLEIVADNPELALQNRISRMMKLIESEIAIEA